MSDKKNEFGGFVPPTKNYFHMPNEWINICADIKSLAELKIVQYVLRHTWGFHEYDGKPKPITIDEFMHGRLSKGERMDKGTGLSKQSVVDGVKNAIKNGYLICEIDDTDRARVEKSYALNMAISNSDVKNLDIENGCQESRHRVSTSLTARVKNLDSESQESRQRSEKETRERHFGKTRKKESTQTSANSQPDDSLIPSSTPSLSLDVDNSVDNQPSSVDDTQPLIAKETTSTHPLTAKLPPMEQARQDDADLAQLNKRAAEIERQNATTNSVESLTTGNASSQAYNCKIPDRYDFSPEERQIQEWWCAQKDLVLRPPKCTDKLKEHWSELAKYIHSLEEMTSLCQYAKATIKDNPNRKDKTVYPGNLVDCLDRWKQSLPSKSQTGTTPSKLTSISGLQNVTLNPPPQPEIADKPMVKLPEFKLRRMNKPSSVAQ